MKLYVIYDNDCSLKPVHGVFDSLDKATAAVDKLVDNWVKIILAGDPSDTGINPNEPIEVLWVEKDCRDSISIQEIEDINFIAEIGEKI